MHINFASVIKKASIAVLVQNYRINFLKFKTMKRNRNPTNKHVMKRYATLYSSIISRLFLVRSSIGSRSNSVHPPLWLRSSSVRGSKNNDRYIGTNTKRQRSTKWKLTKRKRNQTVFFNHLNSNY